MRTWTLAASLTLAALLPADTALTPTAPAKLSAQRCAKTYTVKMAARAIRTVYAGTHHVSRQERRELAALEGCLRNPSASGHVRALNRRARQAWQNRRHPWNGPVTASWFDDSGATSCGTHATYGFATLLSIPCGSKIEMRGPGGRTVTATREDSGPYVSGRTFDLNPGLKAALGCGDLCAVQWR